MRALPVSLVLTCAFITASCATDQLEPSLSDLAVTPGDRLDFGTVPIGSHLSRTVLIENRGRADITVGLDTRSPWSIGESSVRLPGGSQRALTLDFAPAAEGTFEGFFHVTSESRSFALELSGGGRPACVAHDACATSVFDEASSACVESALSDGTPCSSGCLPDGICLGGRCRGASTCDDGDPCTVDACGDSGTCISQPVQCPAPLKPCEVAFCDPSKGCGTTTASDGTPCGRTGCDVSDVCIAGQCVARQVPEGGPCGVASYCQARGTCRGGVCDQPPGQIQPVWFAEGFFGEILADAAGNLYALRTKPPDWNKRYLASLDPDGAVRWENDIGINPDLWSLIGGTIVGATPQTAEGAEPAPSQIFGWSSVDGSLLWSIDLKTALAADLAKMPTVLDVLVASVFEDDVGRIGLLVRTDRYLPRAVWLLLIDPGSGAVVRRVEFGHDIYGGAVASGGDFVAQLDVGTSSASGRGFASVDTAGNVNWLLPARSDTLPIAMTNSGPVAGWDPYPWEADEKCGVLDAAGNVTVALPNGSCVQPVLADSDQVFAVHDLATSSVRPIGLSAHSLSTGGLAWNLELMDVVGGFLNRATSDPILTDEGTIVLGVRDASASTPLVLFDVSSDGQILSACEAPEDDYFYMSDAATLIDGKWIMPASSSRGFGFVALPIPNRSPAKHGWSARDGNAQRTRRLR